MPKRHVESFFDLTPTEAADAHALLHAARRTIDAEHRPDGYTIGINDGRAAGRTVDHVHIHLIPRRYGDVDDPRGGIRRGLPNDDPDQWADRRAACSGTDGFCDVHDFHRHAPTPDGLRDRYAEAIGLHRNGPASDGLGWYRNDEDLAECLAIADAVLAVRDEELLRLRAETATADQIRADVQRDRDRLAATAQRRRRLAERWENALRTALNESSDGAGADTARHCGSTLTHPSHKFMRLDVVFNCPGTDPEDPS